MKTFKTIIVWTIGLIITTAIMLGAFLYATSAEVWYAGEHDSHCEGGDHCHCYERLVEADNANK